MQTAIREKAQWESDYRIVHPDGPVRDIHTTAHPVFSPTGDLIEFMGTVIDITERKRGEALFAGEKHLLERIATGVALNEILNALCLIIEEYRPGTLASILLLRSDGLHLDSVAGPSLPKAWREEMERLPIGPCAGSCGTAAYRGLPVMVSDIATDPLWEVPEHRAAALSHGLRASWSNPILSSDRKVLGTFCIYGCETRSPSAQDLGLIEKATHLARVAIERDRAEEDLRASGVKYRHLVDTTPAFVHTALPNGDLDFFNRGWLEYLGLSITDLLGWRWTSAIHAEDVEELVAKWRAALESGEAFVAEARVRRADGKYRWFLHRKRPQRNEAGEIVKWYGSSIEIEERKIAEEAIRRGEAFLAEGQRLSHTGSFGWNYGATGELTWSEETYRICGFDSSIKPTHELVRERVHPDDLQVWQQAFDRAAEGKEVDFENRLVMSDGTVKFLHSVAYGVQKDGKLVELVGTVRDITEHKLAEDAIRRSEAFLAEGQRLSHTGSWGWNASTGKVTWSPEHFRILGLDPQATDPSLDVFWERIHPDDRIGLRRTFESAIRDKRDFAQEFRIVTPDWSIRHLHGVGHAILNKANELVEFIGSAMDITERKRAEERAQSQREAMLLALNAFVEKLDVNRFLGDVIAEVNKQFHAKSWEFWLFDEAIGALLLHSSSHPSEYFSPAVGSEYARPLEELQGIWQIKHAARAPQILQLSAQESLLSRRHGELLKRQGIKTLMIVPLILGEQNLGFLELHFQSQTQFTSDDLELAQALVNHATLALQLNRLTRRAEQLAVTEERNRLAREIHDTLAQAFAGVVLHGEVLRSSLGINKLRTKRALSQMEKLARSGLEEARRSVQALRPKALDGNTLPEALQQAAIRLNDDAKLSCQFKQRGKKIHLSGEIQNELFRIAQEALTNVVKHAQAKSVWITLNSQARRVSLSIKDDGVGFATARPQDQSHGFGMGTMRERAHGIGGRLRVESCPGRGTTIRVEVPSNQSKRRVKQ